MSKEKSLQNDEFILPGNLGSVQYAGNVNNITKIVKRKDGAVTLTLSQVVDNYLNGVPIIEDAEFEIIESKQITDK